MKVEHLLVIFLLSIIVSLILLPFADNDSVYNMRRRHKEWVKQNKDSSKKGQDIDS